jgi:hypothetical protein
MPNQSGLSQRLFFLWHNGLHLLTSYFPPGTPAIFLILLLCFIFFGVSGGARAAEVPFSQPAPLKTAAAGPISLEIGDRVMAVPTGAKPISKIRMTPIKPPTPFLATPLPGTATIAAPALSLP